MSGYEASYADGSGSTVAVAQACTEQAAVKAVNEVMRLRLSQRVVRGPVQAHHEEARTMRQEEASGKLGDAFDATVRSLEGQQDAIKVAPTTQREIHQILGTAQTYIVQTYRTERGDTVLIEYIAAGETMRIALPPRVADTLARHRDALTSKNRRLGAEKAQRTREERGIKPNFRRKG